ncbi:MAG: AAA family ATPase [Kiritimatiellae bacterium]|nr:AAA family ATPase [Kiritimatiellia bacterium]
MSSLTLTFESAWIDTLKGDGIRLIRQLEKWVAGRKGSTLKSSNRNSLTVEMEACDRMAFIRELKGELTTISGEANPERHLTVYGDTKGLDVPTTPPEPERTERSERQPPPAAAESGAPRNPTPEEIPKPVKLGRLTDDADDPQVDPQQVIEDFCKEIPMKYNPNLRQYLHEIGQVIPMLQQMAVVPSFWQQNLMLSIDIGYGLTSFIKALSRIYAAFGIANAEINEKSVKELVIRKNADGEVRYDDWETAISTAKDMHRANSRNGTSRSVLCLDIAQWQSDLNSAKIKDFLRELNEFGDTFVYVFRVPFMETHILRDISDALNDVMNVRTLIVPPMVLNDMVDYAQTKLGKQAFKLDEAGIGAFEQWILKEKGDDSFFGYKTLDKMIQRLIYEKALSNCDIGQADRVIVEANMNAFTSPLSQEESPEAELNQLIGLDSVKQKLREIIVQIKTQKRLAAQGKKIARPSIHMIFSGNPGTGKTTLARIVARMMKQEGILRKGYLFEVKGRDLCGKYVGHTAPKTSAYCRDAYGSVLFIDEAYGLFRGEDSSIDYGREALETLVAEMENHRDDFCVILAGYEDDMKTLLKGNSGLESRIPFFIDFPNYSREELERIFFSMLGKNFECEEGVRESVRDFFNTIPDDVLHSKAFSNARLVRNLFERVWGKAAYRCSMNRSPVFRIMKSDLALATEEHEFKRLLTKSDYDRHTAPIGF